MIAILYIVSVILCGGAMYLRYKGSWDGNISIHEKLLAVFTPLIPLVNLLVLCGLVDEYMRSK